MSLPFNEEIERRFLSTLMFGAAEVQAAVAAGVTADSFYIPLHHAIFRALCLCATNGKPTNAFEVWNAMAGLSGGSTKTSEVALQVGQIEGIEPTSSYRASLTNDVLSLQRQRTLLKALSGAQEEAQKSAASWVDCWERVEPYISAAQEAAQNTGARPISEMLDEGMKMLADPDLGGLPGPFPSWDRQARMLRKGQYSILAARPGVGKTALALQYLVATLKTGRHAAIFSLEMTGGELFERLGHQISRSTDKTAASKALESLKINNLHIFEARDHSTMAQIENRCKLLASACDLGIVIVDYLQLITPPHGNKGENRENQVREMSRRFKLLAGVLPCPVLLLCQLNRQSEIQERRPKLSDLRESGAIEQDADVVWFLWENVKDLPLDSESETAEIHLIQAKRRNGRANIYTKLSFHRPTVTFAPIMPGLR